MSFKVISIHKEESLSYDKIQDKYSISNKRFCVSDGTTQGYDSGKFAELLSDNFTNNNVVNRDDFFEISLKTSKNFNNRKVKESGNKAIDKLREDKKKKGGSSTLIGCNLDGDDLHVLSYGDSMLFHLRDGKVIEKYPFDDSKQLDESSFFINSNIEYDSELFNDDALGFHKINLKKGDQIILSTDAISKYFLNNNNEINKFNEFNSFETFKDFILINWKQGNIERDDITILIYEHDGSSSVTKIIPPDDFKFKEPETPKLNATIDKNLKSLNREKNDDLINQLVEKDEEIFYLRDVNKNLKLYLSISLISLFIFVAFVGFMIFESDNSPNISDGSSPIKIDTIPPVPVVPDDTINNEPDPNRFDDITMNYELDESQENPVSSDEIMYDNDALVLPDSGNSTSPQNRENDVTQENNDVTQENNDVTQENNDVTQENNNNDYSNNLDDIISKNPDSITKPKQLPPIQISASTPITFKQLSDILTTDTNDLKRMCKENNIYIERNRSELDQETIKSIVKLFNREVIFHSDQTSNEEQVIEKDTTNIDSLVNKN